MQTLKWFWSETRFPRLVLALVGAVAVLPQSGHAQATQWQSDPVNLVREVTERLLVRLESERSAIETKPTHAQAIIDAAIAPHIDFVRVGRLVLGKHWRRASDSQKRRFVGEFRRLLLRTYAHSFDNYETPQITYLPVRSEKKPHLATVRTRVRVSAASPEVAVDYQLHSKDGPWKVYGVAIEGVNLVTTYRNTFSAEIKQRGIDGLIENLADKNRDHLSVSS